MKRSLLVSCLTAFACGHAWGALSLLNGDFETSPPAAGGNSYSVAGWYESNNTTTGTARFNDWTNNTSSGSTQYSTSGFHGAVNGTTVMVISNGSGYIYQDLGIYDGSEMTISLTGDALIRADVAQVFRGLNVTVWQASAAGVDGTMASALAGAAQLGSTYTTSGIGVGAINTGAIDISGATAGNHIYLQITGGPAGNEATMDNLVLVSTSVPEPASSGLIAIACLSVLMVRHRTC